MARKRASMREGPLAELFRATEAAQRGQGDEPVDEPLPPAAEADDQQTLILDAPPSASAPATPRGCRAARRAALEETVEHVMPTAPAPSRREEAALEETVEHVHDFDVPAVPVRCASGRRGACRRCCAAGSASSRLRLRLRPPGPRSFRPPGPSLRTSRPPADSSSRCPRGRPDSTSVAMLRRTSR